MIRGVDFLSIDFFKSKGDRGSLGIKLWWGRKRGYGNWFGY